MTITLLNIDCMEYMATLPDKAFDLAITDPPYFEGVANENFYGASISKHGVKRLCSESSNWDSNIPKEDYFIELKRISTHQIIWGINYYEFSGTTGRLIWDKKNDESTFSNCEIASCSLIEHVKIFRYLWNGMLQGDMKNKEIRIHPTQKPVKLYQWLLTNYAKPNQRILDTHLGSGSSAIAAHYFGCEFVGCELDKDYYEAAVKRFNQATAQKSLLDGYEEVQRAEFDQQDLL